MTEGNIKRLIWAGFRIFRISFDGYSVKEAAITKDGLMWKTAETHKSKKAAAESYAELIRNEKHLEG